MTWLSASLPQGLAMFLDVWCECPRREWCLSEGVVATGWEILLQPLSCAMQPELSPQHPKWAAFEPSGPGLHSQEKKSQT